MRRVAVYMGTRNYYGQMVIAAKSLLYHTRMDRVWFLIEDDAFPEPLPDVIRCKNISGQTWFPETGPNYHAHWTYTCLLPLAYPEIFPEESRVLRMDDDTIVRKDIGPLLDMDLQDNYTAMVEEPVRSKFPFRYFNAGVCLMDLDKFRRTGIHKKMINMVNREICTAMDQDAINVFCQGQILKIGPEWNEAGHITERHPDPYIRHFAGTLKQYWETEAGQYRDMDWRVKDADED
jgi:lipopolysaccharide biosynthesis glycosyltransferase